MRKPRKGRLKWLIRPGRAFIYAAAVTRMSDNTEVIPLKAFAAWVAIATVSIGTGWSGRIDSGGISVTLPGTHKWARG